MTGTGVTLGLRARGRARPSLARRPVALAALCLGALFVVIVAGVAAGSVAVPPMDTLGILAHRVLGLIHAARADGPGRNGPPDAAANVDEAIVHLEKAAAGIGTASDINLFYTLGRLYLRKGDGDKAVQTLLRVVGLNPGSAQARLSLAQAYVTAGNMAGAIQTLEEIAAEEPRVAAALGQYLEQAGRPADAAKAYATALEATPMNVVIDRAWPGQSGSRT